MEDISTSADFLHFVNRAEEVVQENVNNMALADLDVHAHRHAGLEGDFFVADDEGLFGERDFGREAVEFFDLVGWEDIGADIVNFADDVTEFALGEGVHLDLAGHADANEANVAVRNVHLSDQLAIWHDA